MAGVVVVAGVFEPGSVVTLTQVLDERVLRPEGGDVIGRRIVDDSGNVGWEDLEIGGRYFVSGYVNGTYVATRVIGTDAEAPDTPLSQPPIQPVAPKIGTQEAPQPDESPLIPEEHQDLPVGVPDGVSTGVLEPPPDVSTTEPLYLVEGDVPDTLQASDRQTPQEGAADGSTKASQPLYKPTGGNALDPIPEGVVRYEGPTQPAPAVSEPVEPPAPPEPVTTPAGTFTDTGTATDPTLTSEPSSPASEPSPAPPADAAPPPSPPAPQEAAPAAPSEAAAAGTDAAPAPAADASAPVAAPESPPAAPPTEAPAEVTAAPDAAQPATPATDGSAGATSAAPAPADQGPAPIIREDPLPGAENAPASLAGNPAVDAPADAAPAAPAPAPEAAPAAPDAQPAAAPAAPDAPPQPPSS